MEKLPYKDKQRKGRKSLTDKYDIKGSNCEGEHQCRILEMHLTIKDAIKTIVFLNIYETNTALVL